MTLKVSDVRANLNENIRFAVRIIGKSEDRLRVFDAIYTGKRQIKTVSELIDMTGMTRMRILQEAGKLSGNGIVEQTKKGGETAYKKDKTYTHHKRAIVDLVKHPHKSVKYPTKQEPKSMKGETYKIVLPKSRPKPTEITVDDVESFNKVRNLDNIIAIRADKIAENRIKEFLKKIIGEPHNFQDWGGEKNDLYTNKLRFRSSRRKAAFAIKGKGTSGPLTPKKMGKNADQIGRLLTTEAEVFFVVYHSKVDESIFAQLRAYSIARALNGDRVYYGIIDGDDLRRLLSAYPKEFSRARS